MFLNKDIVKLISLLHPVHIPDYFLVLDFPRLSHALTTQMIFSSKFRYRYSKRLLTEN